MAQPTTRGGMRKRPPGRGRAARPYGSHPATALGPYGITANVIAPGYIEDTEFVGNTMTEDRRNRLISQTLVGRAGRPDDVGAALRYLASPEASFVTGRSCR